MRRNSSSVTPTSARPANIYVQSSAADLEDKLKKVGGD